MGVLQGAAVQTNALCELKAVAESNSALRFVEYKFKVVTAGIQLPFKRLIGLPYRVAKLQCGVMWRETKCISIWFYCLHPLFPFFAGVKLNSRTLTVCLLANGVLEIVPALLGANRPAHSLLLHTLLGNGVVGGVMWQTLKSLSREVLLRPWSEYLGWIHRYVARNN